MVTIKSFNGLYYLYRGDVSLRACYTAGEKHLAVARAKSLNGEIDAVRARVRRELQQPFARIL